MSLSGQRGRRKHLDISALPWHHRGGGLVSRYFLGRDWPPRETDEREEGTAREVPCQLDIRNEETILKADGVTLPERVDDFIDARSGE